MNQGIYRQSALDRMASPERLDESLTLVPRPLWMLLGCFAIALVALVVWSIVTRAPLSVEARGILINRSGLAEVVASQDGRVVQLLALPGDFVRAGQPIALIARTELTRELADARSELQSARLRLTQLQSFNTQQNRREGTADQQRLATIDETRRALEARASHLEKRAAQMAGLIDRGFITQGQLVDVQIELAEVRERLANLDEDALRVKIDANGRQGTIGLLLLDEQRKIDEQTRRAERLEQRLGDEETIRATVAGRITEMKLGVGDVFSPGTALATIAPDQGNLVALMYLPAAQGKRIERGMRAEISPTTVERAIYGHMSGTVVSVTPLPVTAEGMRRILRNDQLVAELTAGGAPIEVRVALHQNNGRFVWSASNGPPTTPTAGSIAAGRIVIADRRIISLVLPGASD